MFIGLVGGRIYLCQVLYIRAHFCVRGAFLSLYEALLSVCEALLCVYRGSGRPHLSVSSIIH